MGKQSHLIGIGWCGGNLILEKRHGIGLELLKTVQKSITINIVKKPQQVKRTIILTKGAVNMTGKHFFEIYNFDYHDGDVSDVSFIYNDMLLTVNRCPMKLVSKEDENSLFMRLKFKNVSELWLWDDDKNYTADVLWEDMWKQASIKDVINEFDNGACCWIDAAFYENEMVVFDYLLRFQCDDVEILEARTNPEYFGTY